MGMASEKGDGEEEGEDPNNGADSISMAERERERRDALLRPLGQRDEDDFPPPLATQQEVVVFSRKNYAAALRCKLGLFSHANAG